MERAFVPYSGIGADDTGFFPDCDDIEETENEYHLSMDVPS
ncbi:MAG: hypothetical protein R3B45_16905 [Bdellovibrionota bacterium]